MSADERSIRLQRRSELKHALATTQAEALEPDHEDSTPTRGSESIVNSDPEVTPGPPSSVPPKGVNQSEVAESPTVRTLQGGKKFKKLLQTNDMTSGLIGVGKVASGRRLVMFTSRDKAQNFVRLFNERLAIGEGIRATVVLSGSTEQPVPLTSAPEGKQDRFQALNARMDTLVELFRQHTSKPPSQQKKNQQPAHIQGNKRPAGGPAKKRGICHLFADNGSCKFGDRCRFRHVQKITDPEEKKQESHC